MADYAISNVARRVVYTNTGVGPYAFTFEVLANTDIAVYRGSTLLTLTTDYTVIINANGTGSVTLVVAGTGNITIVGSRAIQRTSDYTTGGDLFASTLNTDLDSQTIYAQQVAETAERGLKAPVTDPTDINMTLPAKASRVGTVLAFNATTGNPEAGPSIGSVTTVAAQSANINTVATNIASVNTVAGNVANVNTVAGVSGNVTTVASNITNVNAVGADLLEAVSEINTVATDIANVNTVGTNISSVNTVAGISADVTSVAGNSSNINTVAGNNANITTVAGVSANVTTVAGISANVTTVAGINAAVSTVATNNANVSTVATNIASVNTNATNIVAIQNASTNATNAANSATAAQSAQTAAESARDSALAAYDNFDDRYLGSKTSNPTLDNDGNALTAGALYFNSVSGAMQVYTGSAWVAAYVSGTGFLASANNLSDVASTSSARTNLGLGTIATQAASSVAITGGAIDGTTVGATTASTGRFSTLEATGVATVSAGTVSAPAITTTGDTNTGVYFPAADTIAFTEGGVEALRLNSNSQTATSIAGTALLPSFTRTGDENTGIFFPAADTIAFTEGGVESMRINSTGDVGIGTSSPVTKLDVLRASTSTTRFDASQMQCINSGAATTNQAVDIAMRFEDGTYNGTGGISMVRESSTARSGALTFSPIASTGNGTERMRITSAGDVGIGTASPTANTKLDVVSGDSSQQYVDVLRLKTSNSGDVHPAILFENNRNSISNAFKIAMDSSASAGTSTLAIRMKDSGGTFNTAFVLQNDGRLQFNSGYGSAGVAYGCRAWVNFDGTGTPAIRASGNVSSITDNGTGDYTVNFTTAMPDANYVTVGTALSPSNGDAGKFCVLSSGNPASTSPTVYSTTQVRFITGTTSPTVTNQDSTYVGVSIFR